MRHNLTVAAKVISLALLAGFGASMLHHNAIARPDSFGIGISVALIVAAILLYQVWFWRK